jgi:hypothetical protein
VAHIELKWCTHPRPKRVLSGRSLNEWDDMECPTRKSPWRARAPTNERDMSSLQSLRGPKRGESTRAVKIPTPQNNSGAPLCVYNRQKIARRCDISHVKERRRAKCDYVPGFGSRLIGPFRKHVRCRERDEIGFYSQQKAAGSNVYSAGLVRADTTWAEFRSLDQRRGRMRFLYFAA